MNIINGICQKGLSMCTCPTKSGSVQAGPPINIASLESVPSVLKCSSSCKSSFLYISGVLLQQLLKRTFTMILKECIKISSTTACILLEYDSFNNQQVTTHNWTHYFHLIFLSCIILLEIPFCPTVLWLRASTSLRHDGAPLFCTWSTFWSHAATMSSRKVFESSIPLTRGSLSPRTRPRW